MSEEIFIRICMLLTWLGRCYSILNQIKAIEANLIRVREFVEGVMASLAEFPPQTPTSSESESFYSLKKETAHSRLISK